MIAEQYGVSVPFLRSEATSNGFSTTADVIEEVINNYKHIGKTLDLFACIYPTASLLTGKRLAEALNLINEVDAVLSVVKFGFPPQRAFFD